MKFPIELLFNLAAGWAFYLYRVLPQVRVSLPGVVTAVLCLAVLAVGLHWFLRWLHQQRPGPKEVGAPARPPWPARWTGAILGLVVMMFAAGISVVGISHQTGWLFTSTEPIVESSFREVAARTLQAGSMKQLVLAMLNYQEDHKSLPPAATWGKEGQPLLSWRVLILPYLEEESLYHKFRLNEPWDSPHNLRLLPLMPRLYANPSTYRPGTHRTHYQAFVGKGAAFEGKQGLRLPEDFSDGPSHTILIAEAAEAIPWTKPEDLPYDPAGPLPALGSLSPDFFQVATADGAVLRLGRNVSERTLRDAITRNDGRALGPDW
jgi:hypothetical protein